MKFAVEAWATEYGTPVEEADALFTPKQPVVLDVEVPVDAWAPMRPPADVVVPGSIVFIDGVRRVDARVWIDGGGGEVHLGLCASYAAGAVRAGARSEVVACEVARGLFTSAGSAQPITTRHATFAVRMVDSDLPDRLSLALQQRMGELEVGLVDRAGAADLIVIDGPLRGRQHIPHAIGYVKTHHVAYLPPVVGGVVAALAAGERTPLFVTTSSWSRYSWYLRLPGPAAHAWAGIVRCEASADLDVCAARQLADASAAALPRFASRAHKDPRAPQNLYPIAGLERALRHRLGDPALLYRSLRSAAVA
jgi:hypothetical protein